MIDRIAIKQAAKATVSQQWGTAVGISLLYGVISFFISLVLGFIPTPFGILSYISWFVVIPLFYGMHLGYIRLYSQIPTTADVIFANYSENYGRKVGASLLVGLQIFLWGLLLIIPGIIKAYSYIYTTQIIAENPNVTAREAIKLSMRITDGYKIDIFVMHLSFIGWNILSLFTCGLLYIFYVGPYFNTTTAGYYVELKRLAIDSGRVEAEAFC